MKNLFLFLSITLCMIVQSANGQVSEKNIIYKTWVKSYDKSPKIKGYLRGLKDSSIVISTSLNNSKIHPSSVELNIPDVKTIKFRRKGRIGRSILHGALIGVGIGGFLGLASGDDTTGFIRWTAEEKALVGGLFAGVAGGLGGVIVGSFKIVIPINGSQETYESKKMKLTTYL